VEVFMLFCFVLSMAVRVAGSPSPHVAFIISVHGRRLWFISAFAVAFLAIDGSVCQRLERNGAGFAAFGAFCVKVHLLDSPLFAI
jgi:vacuolar-type H+-ATPase subunit I/STV1